MESLPGPISFSPETLFAVELARRAGNEILMPALPLGKRGEREDYKGPRELVTEADRAVERFVYETIKAEYPDHAVYAEEEVREEGAGAPARWIVDPLDGTTNFVHGHPMFAVSIALERAGRLQTGVVYAPYLSEMFYAERGKGAYLNSDRIRLRVSDTEVLLKAVLATGFAYDRLRWPNLENWCRLHEEARGLRRCGAASIDLAYVACGRYDGFWELGLAPYDVAAGAVLVEEAGGRVTDGAGGDAWLDGGSIVATNGRIHDLLRKELEPPEPGSYLPLRSRT
ncbi:MAG: inositol monophosphatase [Planctomycetes bacterium]|nr:inositol monophosphatase [Planctomycetota bacterium]